MMSHPIHRRAFLKAAALASAARFLPFGHTAFGSNRTSDRTNILLLVSEDHGRHLGCYGDPIARTPNIDRFAKEGTQFDNAYVTAASCSPSRASILTGLYPQQHGQIGLSISFSTRQKHVSMHPGTVTLPQLLKQNGYATGILGKIHVDPHETMGFDYRRGSDEDGVSRPSLTELPIINQNWNEQQRTVRYSADVEQMTRDATEFFEANRESPFFLTVHFSDAHTPFHNQVNGYPEKLHKPEEITAPFPFSGQETVDRTTQVRMAAYYNCLARLDASFGQILEALEKTGRADNTLVIFLSDHGPEDLFGDGRTKMSNYEAGLKVPFLMRYPGQDLPEKFDGFISSIDIMPTVLQAAGIEYDAPLPGKSLLDVLKGDQEPHEAVFGDFNRHLADKIWPIRSIRYGDFKLIYNPFAEVYRPVAEKDPEAGHRRHRSRRREFVRYANTPTYEFYDLSKDPYEFNTLIDVPTYAAAFEICLRRLNDWQRQVGDFLLDPQAVAKERHLVENLIEESFG